MSKHNNSDTETDDNQHECKYIKKILKQYRGKKGKKGKDGLHGFNGPIGPMGPTGNQGINGNIGPAGFDGAIGPTGENGLIFLSNTKIDDIQFIEISQMNVYDLVLESPDQFDLLEGDTIMLIGQFQYTQTPLLGEPSTIKNNSKVKAHANGDSIIGYTGSNVLVAAGFYGHNSDTFINIANGITGSWDSNNGYFDPDFGNINVASAVQVNDSSTSLVQSSNIQYQGDYIHMKTTFTIPTDGSYNFAMGIQFNLDGIGEDLIYLKQIYFTVIKVNKLIINNPPPSSLISYSFTIDPDILSTIDNFVINISAFNAYNGIIYISDSDDNIVVIYINDNNMGEFTYSSNGVQISTNDSFDGTFLYFFLDTVGDYTLNIDTSLLNPLQLSDYLIIPTIQSVDTDGNYNEITLTQN